MTSHRSLLAATLLCFSYGLVATAQTPPPADETAPKAASSPHQRDATKKTDTAEAPTAPATQPSSASSPHQREATGMGKSQAEQDKMMKDCMKKEQQKNASMSTQDLKKTCTAMMKKEGSG